MRSDRNGHQHGFLESFFSANGDLLVSTERVEHVFTLSEPASTEAAAACIDASSRTGLRGDIEAISHPCLAIHGDGDVIVPFELSGRRTVDALEESSLAVVENGSDGFDIGHAEELDRALFDFLEL